MKGRKILILICLHIMTIIISFLPGAGYSLNVIKTAKQFNMVQDFTILQVREGIKGRRFFFLKLDFFNQSWIFLHTPALFSLFVLFMYLSLISLTLSSLYLYLPWSYYFFLSPLIVSFGSLFLWIHSCCSILHFLLQISSSWVKIRLKAEHQLPKLSGSA